MHQKICTSCSHAWISLIEELFYSVIALILVRISASDQIEQQNKKPGEANASPGFAQAAKLVLRIRLLSRE
jgi:hypothetical protein